MNTNIPNRAGIAEVAVKEHVMSTAKRLVNTATAILLVGSIVCAQDQNAATGSRSTMTITAAATADRVRFTAPSTVVQMRLEVYGVNGEKLFDNEIRGGNLIDWHLQDGRAEPLSDGSYLCVITSKSVSGRLGQKLGRITIDHAGASVQPIDTTQLTAQQTQAVGPLEENASLTVLKDGETHTATVIAHNGDDGQITRGKGALSFRIGDFYSGKDTEQMRLTPEGNLGIGIRHPRARLDVDGLIRTSQGIMFADGTIQTTAAGSSSGVQTPDEKLRGGEFSNSTKQNKSAGKRGKGDKTVSPELLVNEDLTVNGNIIFTPPSPQFTRDITMQNNNGGLRFLGAPTLTSSPAAAAIQFWGNNSPLPGQLYLDSGANDSAALIFRTTGTGGTIAERMRVTAMGNVGIGTASPTAPLHITPNSSNYAFRIDQGASGHGILSYVNTTSNSQILLNAASNVNGLIVLGNGNVGIGIGAPLATLHVVSLSNSGIDNTADFHAPTIGPNHSHIHYGTTGDWYIRSAASAGKVILQDLGGNVGVGTSNPAGLLHVKGASPVRILGDPSTLVGNESVDFMARSSAFSSDLGGMRIQRQSSGDIDTIFLAASSGSSASEVMRVAGSGTVVTNALQINGALKVRGAGFNTPTTAFIHTATLDNKCGGTTTIIDNPYTNGDPSAILIVTPSQNTLDPYTYQVESYIYLDYGDTHVGCASGPPGPSSGYQKWMINCNPGGNISCMPVSARFNVLVIKP